MQKLFSFSFIVLLLTACATQTQKQPAAAPPQGIPAMNVVSLPSVLIYSPTPQQHIPLFQLTDQQIEIITNTVPGYYTTMPINFSGSQEAYGRYLRQKFPMMGLPFPTEQAPSNVAPMAPNPFTHPPKPALPGEPTKNLSSSTNSIIPLKLENAAQKVQQTNDLTPAVVGDGAENTNPVNSVPK